MQSGKNHPIVSAAVFIVLEIAAVVMLSSTRSLQNTWINRAVHSTLGFVWQGSENIRNYFLLREQNRSLSEENLRLLEELRRLKCRELALAGAVADTVTGSYKYTPATIVKMSRNYMHNYIILNKGTADGITPKSGIISTNGVVGIVDAVDEHFCYGITLQNALISVSSRIGHYGTVAPLEWSGVKRKEAVLKNLPTHLVVEKGDTVFTSGFSGIFPSGIPLGITGNSRTVNGSVQEVEVDLFLDFGTLRYVSIVQNLNDYNLGGAEQ